MVLDGPAFSKRCPAFSKREKIPSYSVRASNTIVLSVKAITAMFSMMDRRRPVSDTATMARRLFSKQAKRRRPTYNINSFLVIVLAFGVNIGGTLMGAGAVWKALNCFVLKTKNRWQSWRMPHAVLTLCSVLQAALSVRAICCFIDLKIVICSEPSLFSPLNS